jgi:hypothetical protein
MSRTINRARFDAARAAVLLAKTMREDFELELAIKYGPGHRRAWYRDAEVRKLDQLGKRRDRAYARMFRLLEASPRNWDSGVPSHWVACELTYADAIKPRTTPLDVTPPLSCGATHPIT